MLFLFSPSSQEVLIGNFPAQGQRCRGIGSSLLISAGMSHLMDEYSNSCKDSHVLKANKQPFHHPLTKKKVLVYNIVSYTYCLEGVKRAFFGARYFKGKAVPAGAV